MSSPSLQQNKTNFFFNFFPVKKEERAKVLVLCLLKGLFSFAFTMVKLQKSSNVVTAHGAEKIAYVKSFVFPLTLLFVTLYTAFSNRTSQRKVLYGIIFVFLGVFGGYTFGLLPFKHLLTPDTTSLQVAWKGYPTFLTFVQMYKHWIQVFFYCAAELFGQFFIIIFFWGIANEIFTKAQAKRIYHILISAGCIGSMIGTQTIKALTSFIQGGYGDIANIRQHKAAILDRTSQCVGFFVLVVLVIVLVLYRWILQQPSLLSQAQSGPIQKEKKMSLPQAFKYIFSNPYLMATTCIIVACGLTSSLFDITYQKYIQNVSKSLPAAYTRWTANQLFVSDLICIFTSLFLTHRISRKFSWKANAYITPVAIMLLGGSFFVLSFLNHKFSLDALSERFFGVKAYVPIAFMGSLQAVFAVFFRYVFFDSTKEIIFISLGPEARRRSKGAVDVVGSRLGKLLSSQIHVFVLGFFQVGGVLPPVEHVSHILLSIFLFFGMVWLLSIRYLAPKVEEQQQQKA